MNKNTGTPDLPSEDNSHEKNVQLSIESILGTKTKLSHRRKSAEDKRKDMFCTVIEYIIHAEARELILAEEFNIDLANYNNMYHQVIDGLMDMFFTPTQVNCINSYLSVRSDDPEVPVIVELESGERVVLNNHADLYDFIKNIK